MAVRTDMDQGRNVPIAFIASLTGGVMNGAAAHNDAIAEIVDRIGYRFIRQIWGWPEEVHDGVFRKRLGGRCRLGDMDQRLAEWTATGDPRHRIFNLQMMPIRAFYLDRHRSISHSCPQGKGNTHRCATRLVVALKMYSLHGN